jgi:hypothetical protein
LQIEKCELQNANLKKTSLAEKENPALSGPPEDQVHPDSDGPSYGL